MITHYSINYQKLDQALSILQRNNWKTSIISAKLDFPFISAEHYTGKKILLLFVESEDDLKKLDKSILEEFKSINGNYGHYTKYWSFFKANTLNESELILKEMGK